MPQMISTIDHVYADRKLEAGAPFFAAQEDVMILLGVGHAMLAPEVSTAEPDAPAYERAESDAVPSFNQRVKLRLAKRKVS